MRLPSKYVFLKRQKPYVLPRVSFFTITMTRRAAYKVGRDAPFLYLASPCPPLPHRGHTGLTSLSPGTLPLHSTSKALLTFTNTRGAFFPAYFSLPTDPTSRNSRARRFVTFLDSQIRDMVCLRPLLSISASDPSLALPGRAVDFLQRVHAAASGRLRLPPLAFWRLCVAALSVRATDSRTC